jgi:uncharacterized protein
LRIYPKKIPVLAREIVDALMKNGDIEVEPEKVESAREDFASIMREYQRQEDNINEDAKVLLARRNWPSTKYSEARRIIAEQRRFPMGDDALDYVINQMLEFMLITNSIEEVYAGDHVMRKRIVTILRAHLKADEDVDEEARRRLKHLQEGTADWDIQYKRVCDQIRRNKGLI